MSDIDITVAAEKGSPKSSNKDAIIKLMQMLLYQY